MANLEFSEFKNLNTVTEDLESGDNEILYSRFGSANMPDVPTVELFNSSGALLGFQYTLGTDKITVNNPTGSTVTGAQIRIS